MSRSTLRWFLVSLLALGFVGCGESTTGGDGGFDSGTGLDGGTVMDGSAGDDAAPRMDATMGDDAAADAAADDAAADDAAADDAATADAGADAATVTDAAPPTDSGPSACADNSDCAPADYCQKTTCGAATGVCATRPRFCPDVVMPVCGCDGVTYGNPCEAAAAGVNVGSSGMCPSTGACTSDADCGGTDYCRFVIGACGGTGTCTMRSGPICSGLYDPMCGCNGTTYSNPCNAGAAGMSIASRGACSSSCGSRPPLGCCYQDADCTSPVGRPSRCEGGVCATTAGVCVDVSIASGSCWNDGDCRAGETCMGARICPCGALCILPDAPGRCR